jgi:hypothetical protein
VWGEITKSMTEPTHSRSFSFLRVGAKYSLSIGDGFGTVGEGTFYLLTKKKRRRVPFVSTRRRMGKGFCFADFISCQAIDVSNCVISSKPVATSVVRSSLLRQA